MTYEDKLEALVGNHYLEDYFYNPDALTDEELQTWKDEVNHEVYPWTMDLQDEVISYLNDDLSDEAIKEAIEKAGYKIGK